MITLRDTAACLALAAGVGCAALASRVPSRTAAERAAAVFACRVAALEPYVGSVYNTEDLVRDALSGKANLSSTFAGLGLKYAELVAGQEAWDACGEPDRVEMSEAAPAPDAGAGT